MTIIINSYNTLSAGTSNVTRLVMENLQHWNDSAKTYVLLPNIELFKDLPGNKQTTLVRLPVFPIPLQPIFRFIYDFILLPLIAARTQADIVLIMANYAPVKLRARKVVLVRHPYLFDDPLLHQAGFVKQIIERMRRLLFSRTIKSADDIIVQSEYMQRSLLSKHNVINPKVHVLPNPIRKHMHDRFSRRNNGEAIALYVSRFYPHKNHDFIVNMAEVHQDAMRREGIKIYITVDAHSCHAAKIFLRKVESLHLNDVIVNLGHVPNQDLHEYYNSAACLFFPSEAETFGNPLVEAMSVGLPILVPRLKYAETICEDAACYYEPDDIHDAFHKLRSICMDQDLKNNLSTRSLRQSKQYPTVEEWLARISRIIHEDK